MMILNISARMVTVNSGDVMINGNDIEDSDEQMEHIIDFIAEKYGRDTMMKYVDSVYRNED